MQRTTTIHDVLITHLGECNYPSPIRRSVERGHGIARFVPANIRIRNDGEVSLDEPSETVEYLFEKAGPREKLFFDPAQTRAAIVTCGGLCPGLNDVIRSLYIELIKNYGIREVLGVRYGFQGLDPTTGEPPIVITHDYASMIQGEGGTRLGSSRGQRDVCTMIDTLVEWGVNILFCVGGDGTQRGAMALVNEIAHRQLSIAVVGIPKTIDNDILYCDRTFGLVTAVAEAVQVIHYAHVEAKGAPRGIGLVQVMGRDAGFIACGATIAGQEANLCLIPEVPFALQGENGLFALLERRLQARDHAVIVVAEGAGQHLCAGQTDELDASGNRKHQDIGIYLRDQITAHFKSTHRPVELKYIDPSYIIRSASPNTEDRYLCDQLARNAAHAAMAGKTGLLICFRNGTFTHVPIPMAVARKKSVNPEGTLWASVVAATGQPTHIG